jgi:hypothetical protein
LKFKVLLLLFSLLLSQNVALAAPLPTVKNLPISFAIESDFDVSNAILTKDAVVLVGSKSGTAEISARTFEGAILWRFSPPQSSIATDIKSATDGSFWILGSSEVFDTSTVVSTSGAINPDSIIVTSPSPKSRGLVSLNIWQISSTGQLLSTFSHINSSVSFPRALYVASEGIFIIGDQQSASGRVGVIWICTFTSCAAPIVIGKSETSLRDLTLINKEIYIVGLSRDSITKLPLKGVTDGIVLRASTSGAIKGAFRSSLPKTYRKWESVTSSLLQGGISIGKITEASVTQFNSSPGKFGVPVWSARFPARSGALTAGVSALFSSTGGISALTSWKPKSPQLLLLTFDSKGRIKSGTTINNGGSPVSFDYLKGLGYGVISSLSNTMYFTLVRE